MITDHQLGFAWGGSGEPAHRKTSARQNRRPLPASTQGALPLVSRRFLPVAGVPRTRAECPPERHCPHIRCRHHLFLEDADTRAGRPGLRSVQRDERGWTTSQPGEAGKDRAGTTVNPRWLTLQGEPAELERCCPAWIWLGEDGQLEVNVDPARWAHMKLRVGDALDVVNRIDDLRVTWARVAANDEIAFDEMPHRHESMFVYLVRKRLIQSCALDVADRGSSTNEETGFHLGRHRTLVARINRQALRHGVENAEEAGMEREDFVRAIMSMGSERC